jgi:hypothetical protein
MAPASAGVSYGESMYIYQEFPKMKYHESGSYCIVDGKEAEDALGEGWHDLPLDQQTILTREDLEGKANALGIKLDKRWSDSTLKSKIDEAQGQPQST